MYIYIYISIGNVTHVTKKDPIDNIDPPAVVTN